MRLFIAVNFQKETSSNLLALQAELRAQSTRGRFSAPENLHLTLVFLGECDESQRTAAQEAMDAVDFESFPITVDRVGRFRGDRGDTWWAGVSESRSLLDLQQRLTNELIKLGFSLEKRQYNPHITLGRNITSRFSPRAIEPFGESVSRMELMKSEQNDGELTYTSIYLKHSTAL